VREPSPSVPLIDLLPQFGFEYVPGEGPDAHVTWVAAGNKTWRMTAATVPPRPELDMSQRLIAVEPVRP
jgi:hypothetical protein